MGRWYEINDGNVNVVMIWWIVRMISNNSNYNLGYNSSNDDRIKGIR